MTINVQGAHKLFGIISYVYHSFCSGTIQLYPLLITFLVKLYTGVTFYEKIAFPFSGWLNPKYRLLSNTEKIFSKVQERYSSSLAQFSNRKNLIF